MDARNRPAFLSHMPERLAAAALVNGEEAAWEQGDCAAVIDWLRNAGYALLGIELWLMKKGQISTFINTAGGPVLYCSSCDPRKGESWDGYVERSTRLAAAGIAAFRWPEDSLEPCPAYFNLTWADRQWFQARNKFGGT
jgi:hypothetical protein